MLKNGKFGKTVFIADIMKHLFFLIAVNTLLATKCSGQINRPPEFLQGGDLDKFSLSEDTPVGTEVYTLRARDPENTPVHYYISGDSFSVDRDTGVVKLIRKLDRESVATVDVIISITDQAISGLQANTISIRREITILDENDNPPKFHNVPYSFSLDETAPVGTTVYRDLVITDADIGRNAEIRLSCLSEETPVACQKFEVLSTSTGNGKVRGEIVLVQSLDYEERSSYSMAIVAEVLTALRFFATGSYQSPIGNDVYIMLSQQSVSRCIRDVSKQISMHLLKKFVVFPQTDEEISSVKQTFFNKYGFPGVIGAIDCTHVSIVPPSSTDAAVYINRKGYTSINVQLIVGPDLRITGISARYPGSVHDAFIWRNSAAKRHISQLAAGWLIGDNGYPLEPCLMTPFLNAQPETVEDVFSRRLSSARACVERCNGVLKGRFRCLLKDRVLHYSPTAASHIINACAVLHNICIQRRIDFHEELPQEDFNDDILTDEVPTSSATNIRYRIAFSMS